MCAAGRGDETRQQSGRISPADASPASGPRSMWRKRWLGRPPIPVPACGHLLCVCRLLERNLRAKCIGEAGESPGLPGAFEFGASRAPRADCPSSTNPRLFRASPFHHQHAPASLRSPDSEAGGTATNVLRHAPGWSTHGRERKDPKCRAMNWTRRRRTQVTSGRRRHWQSVSMWCSSVLLRPTPKG
jgi:hypothetical protein